MTRFGWLLIGLIGGCAYVTEDEFLAAWDKDEDGWPAEDDCNDDPEQNGDKAYPFAPDIRGDGCDADCARAADADGDDWPDDADCNPDDSTVFPCSDAEQPDDDVDSDCDGYDAARVDVCLGWDPDFEEAEQTRFSAENCPFPAVPTGG